MNKLKPCPFCGGTKHLVVFDDGNYNGDLMYYVYCRDFDGCGVTGPLGTTKKEAIEKWNRRANPSDIPAAQPEVSDICAKDINVPSTICRQAVIEAIESVDWYHQDKNNNMVRGADNDRHQAWYKVEDVYEVINNLPAAQPERKKGQWVYTGMSQGWHTYECSECGDKHMTGDEARLSNFCSNCGADMRKDNNE